jgi:hypothetical protein
MWFAGEGNFGLDFSENLRNANRSTSMLLLSSRDDLGNFDCEEFQREISARFAGERSCDLRSGGLLLSVDWTLKFRA